MIHLTSGGSRNVAVGGPWAMWSNWDHASPDPARVVRMNAFALTIGLSLVSAVAYASAAVLQQRLAATSSFTAALRHPRWWLSVGLNIVGALLHAGALRYGPLTVVQPLGTLTLVLALPLGATLGRRKVTRSERRGATATVIGLAGLLALTAESAPVHVLGTGAVLMVGSVTVAALVGLIAIAHRSPYSSSKALTYAAGAGIASGVASGLAQTVVVAAGQEGLTAFVHPAVFVVLAMATGGLLLSQAAYRDSGLGAPLAMSTLANPIAAAAIGLTLLGEGYTAGFTGSALAVVAAIVAGYGVAVLASGTPTITTTASQPASPRVSQRRATTARIAGSRLAGSRLGGSRVADSHPGSRVGRSPVSGSFDDGSRVAILEPPGRAGLVGPSDQADGQLPSGDLADAGGHSATVNGGVNIGGSETPVNAPVAGNGFGPDNGQDAAGADTPDVVTDAPAGHVEVAAPGGRLHRLRGWTIPAPRKSSEHKRLTCAGRRH